MEKIKTYEQLNNQVEYLENQLNEAHEIIEAIRKGEVDAFVVKNETENKHELYTLKSADKTYRTFIEKMNEGAIAINKEGTVLYANSKFANIINTNLENVIGSKFLNLVPLDKRNAVGNLITNAWIKDEIREEIILPGNNKPISILLSLNTMEIDGGMALSIIATDLSLQKVAQEQKKEIEKKDEFISIASHELKSPVTSIKGYVQLLQFNFQKEGNTAAAELLRKVDLQVNKLTELINDLLDVKKIENGELRFHEELFDFNDLINEIIEETGRIFTKHLIACELAETKKIFGDRNKIGQVITNLMENAAKYSLPASEIKIRSVNQNDKVRLLVQDLGIGIPKDQQKNVFERFFRVKKNTENTYSGLGLGLYISAEIIRRHKGYIGVESEEGKGSTFYFDLPIEK